MDLVKFIRNCIIRIVLETNFIFFLNALDIMIISIIIHNFDCKYMNAHVHRCLCVWVWVCVRARACACVHTCACALRILSTDRIFHFTNTFIIIITCQPCASILPQTTALTESGKVDKVHLSSFFRVLFLCLLNEKDVFTETVCMFCVVYNLRYFHFLLFLWVYGPVSYR